MTCPRRTLRQDRPGPRPARQGLRRRLLRPAGVEARGRGHQDHARRDRGAGARGTRRPGASCRPAATRWSRLRHQYLDRQLVGARGARPHGQGRAAVVRRGVQGALRRRRADAPGVALSEDSRHAREALPGPGLAGRALRRLAPAVRHSAREARRGVSDGHQGLPRADGASTSRCRANESFTVEYVTNKSWSGYNWYQGNYRSLIQVNTDLPIYIDRAIDLACHEGYPGHHVYNALLEKHLVRDRGWVEFTVYPLFSPQSLIAEGTANYGIEVAFPGNERIEFERTVLFPAAGLDRLDGGRVLRSPGARRPARLRRQRGGARLLDGKIVGGRGGGVSREVRDVRRRNARKQRVRFIEQYRSYVINYNLGQGHGRGATSSRAAARPTIRRQRWAEFEKLLSSPRLPSGLQ